MDQRFGKAYKLCKRKVIDSLFKDSKSLRSYPFVVYFREEVLDEPVPFQVVLAAPKRNFKRAHDRNFVKRLMRESLRKQKTELEQVLQSNSKQIALFILYNQRELPHYSEIEKAMGKLIQKLVIEIAGKNAEKRPE